MRKFSKTFVSSEQRKNTKSAVFYIFLTIVTVVLLYFVGIPILGKLTTLISSIKNNNKEISSSDITPPPTPKFKYFPEFTNQKDIILSGNTESGATVKLTFNGKEQEVLTDSNGQFSFNISLNDGINTFAAVATDSNGNTSQKTDDLQISYDTKSPDLEINSPADNSSYFGSTQRQVTIAGTTEDTTSVTINDRIISVDDKGSFQYTTTLNEGINTFNIKATDQAGNSTEKSLTLNFTP